MGSSSSQMSKSEGSKTQSSHSAQGERDSTGDKHFNNINHLHQTIGNRALSQMLGASITNASGVVLQRKCASGGSAGSSGECDECRAKRLPEKSLQAKLRINEPGDVYEQEADRVAEKVMRMPECSMSSEAMSHTSSPLVQRRVNTGNSNIGEAPPVVRNVLSSLGRPLDLATRAFFESRLGYDLKSVRIHTGSAAEQSAQDVNARAFTVGRDVVFAKGQFSPKTNEGRQLLAHELTHVVQQAETSGPDGLIFRQEEGVDVDTDIDEAEDVDVSEPESPFQITLDELAFAMDSFDFSNELLLYSGSFKGETRFLNDYQYQGLRSKTHDLIFVEINKARKTAKKIEAVYKLTQEANQNHFLSSTYIIYRYGIQDPGDALANKLAGARYYANLSEAALLAKDFTVGYELIEQGKHEVQNAGYDIELYRDQLISSAGEVMKFATDVRRFSVNALIGTGAVIVAPAAIAGFGLLGGGILVVGGGAVLGGYVEGGVNVVDQAMAGEGFDVDEFRELAEGGAKSGLVSSAAGFAGGAVGSRFSPQTSMLITGPASGVAAGSTGRGLGALVEGKSIPEVFSDALWGGVEGAIGGLLSGATTRFISVNNLSLAARTVVGGAGNMIAGGLSAKIVGRSDKEIAESALMGLVFGMAEGIDTVTSPNTLQTGGTVLGVPSEKPPWKYYGEDPDYGIIFAKSGDEIVGVHPDYPYTIFRPQGLELPKVFTGKPGGTITEVPWPFTKRLVAGPDSPDIALQAPPTNASQSSIRSERAIPSEPVIAPQASITTRSQAPKKVTTPKAVEKKAKVKPPKQTKQPILTNVPEPIQVKESSLKRSTKKPGSGESIKGTPEAKKGVGKDTKEKARKSPEAKEPVKAPSIGKGDKPKVKTSQSAARKHPTVLETTSLPNSRRTPSDRSRSSGQRGGMMQGEAADSPELIHAMTRGGSSIANVNQAYNDANAVERFLRAQLSESSPLLVELQNVRQRLDVAQPKEILMSQQVDAQEFGIKLQALSAELGDITEKLKDIFTQAENIVSTKPKSKASKSRGGDTWNNAVTQGKAIIKRDAGARVDVPTATDSLDLDLAPDLDETRVPLTFSDKTFRQFAENTRALFTNAGYDDAQFFMQGSAASRVRHSTGESIEIPNDFDIAVVSAKLSNKANEEDIVFSGAVKWDQLILLDLHDVQIALTQMRGTVVNFKVYQSIEDVKEYGQQSRPF